MNFRQIMRDPQRAAGFLVFMEYDQPQIRRFLIEECGCEPEVAERLYREAKEAYDAEEAAEDDAASSIATMRPIAEVAVAEERLSYDRAIASEHVI